MEEMNIKKKRVMMYFIEATQELILDEGLEKLSIKKIAEKAGYNSATIYNYFENLEVLILYASVNYLKDYLNDLKNEITTDMKAIEVYETVYRIFTKHSFEQPEIFHILLLMSHHFYIVNHLNSYKLENIIKKYYEIFPDEIEGHIDLTKAMLIQGNIYDRDLPIINKMVKEGNIKEEEAKFIMETVIRVHQSYLSDLLYKNNDSLIEEYTQGFFKIFKFLLKKGDTWQQ